MTALPLFTGRDASIDAIHRGTAIYTVAPEIEALLDRLDWPASGSRLLDPGCGNGGVVVAALARLRLRVDHFDDALRVVGYEFHPSAVFAARMAVLNHLADHHGWSRDRAAAAANLVIQERDFLLSPVPVGDFDVIAANPPYWRLANLPAEYRVEYETMVPPHARADLLFAYLQRAADIAAPGGVIGLVTADRWLLTQTSAELRRRLGLRYTVRDFRRLDSASAFYRPKTRTRGTPARVHPVSLVLDPAGGGAPLTAAPFKLDAGVEVEGRRLVDLANIHIAPWLGPDGIFTVDDRGPFNDAEVVPVLEPADLDTAAAVAGASRRWALVTHADSEPSPAVRDHLRRELYRMPPRGRRSAKWWLPPETFTHRLPLAVDAVLVPRIARRLTPIRIPAGVLPIKHNLVIVSGHPPERIIAWLNHPDVQAQADSVALRLENGFASFTSSLLKDLRIPTHLVSEAA